MHDGTNEWTDFNVISSVMTSFDNKSLVMILVMFPMTQARMTQMAIKSGAEAVYRHFFAIFLGSKARYRCQL